MSTQTNPMSKLNPKKMKITFDDSDSDSDDGSQSDIQEQYSQTGNESEGESDSGEMNEGDFSEKEEGEIDSDDEESDEDDEVDTSSKKADKLVNTKTTMSTKPVLETSEESEIMKQILETTVPDEEIELDSDEDMDDEYLQKFDESIRKDVIIEYHPEILQSNYDEISALTRVVRDEHGNIIDPLHKTIPILTKYEKARILGLRAKQLNHGNPPFIKIPDNIIDGHLIAEMELKENVIPFIISRPLPGGKKEYWRVQDLEMVDF
jgi:DNA-directed RNA polymerase subunit K/omega